MIQELKDIDDEKQEPAPPSGAPEEEEAQSTQDVDDWQNESIKKLAYSQLFQGWQGKLIMIGGVISPSLILAFAAMTCTSRVMLLSFNHPIETLVELLLVANIPVSIGGAWISHVKGHGGYSFWRSISLGASISTSLLISILSLSGLVVSPAAGTEAGKLLAMLLIPSLIAATAGIVLVEKIRRTREFSSSRRRVVMLTGLGVIAAAILSIASEASPWMIRLAERQSVSSVASEHLKGLRNLRSINPARELLIECSDERAVGLCGIFMPLSNSSQRELYFAVTGEPFNFRDIHNTNLASVSDESLARQLLGEPINGLSLTRSSMTGKINPETLATTLDWTFVFKNDTAKAQSARAVVALPPRATATKCTLWSDGKPDDAIFYGASAHTAAQTGPVWNFKDRSIGEGSSCTTLSMTDIGNGRVLIDCAPVQSQDEVKVRLTVMIPMNPDTAKTAALALPRFLGTNFDLSGEHQIRLRSSLPIKTTVRALKTSRSYGGDYIVTGALTASETTNSSLLFNIDRPIDPPPITTAYKSSDTSQTFYIEQRVKSVPAKIPSQLIFVIDGSVALNKYRKEICRALKHVSSAINTTVIISSADKKDEPMTVRKAIETIEKTELTGGQDNLKSVIKATDLAGETADSALLWVHGPQPTSNREIYIMSQYESKPRFYDVPVESSTTDTNDFFKNYSEIGPFEVVPGNGAVELALDNLSKKWKPGAMDYAIEISTKRGSVDNSKVSLGREFGDIVMLWAHDQCLREINKAKLSAAEKIALDHKFLSPLSAARITITAQAVNSVQLVTGVDTSGTVRVNSLANMEALLNIVANTATIAGLIWGGWLFCGAFREFHEKGIKFRALAAGIAIILIGLGVPGWINWLVASARDANLYS